MESFFYCSLYITGQRWSGRVSLMMHMNVAELVWRGNISFSQISHVDWIKRNKLVTDLFMGFKIADVSHTVQWEVRKTEQRSRWRKKRIKVRKRWAEDDKTLFINKSLEMITHSPELHQLNLKGKSSKAQRHKPFYIKTAIKEKKRWITLIHDDDLHTWRR